MTYWIIEDFVGNIQTWTWLLLFVFMPCNPAEFTDCFLWTPCHSLRKSTQSEDQRSSTFSFQIWILFSFLPCHLLLFALLSFPFFLPPSPLFVALATLPWQCWLRSDMRSSISLFTGKSRHPYFVLDLEGKALSLGPSYTNCIGAHFFLMLTVRVGVTVSYFEVMVGVDFAAYACIERYMSCSC